MNIPLQTSDRESNQYEPTLVLNTDLVESASSPGSARSSSEKSKFRTTSAGYKVSQQTIYFERTSWQNAEF